MDYQNESAWYLGVYQQLEHPPALPTPHHGGGDDGDPPGGHHNPQNQDPLAVTRPAAAGVLTAVRPATLPAAFAGLRALALAVSDDAARKTQTLLSYQQYSDWADNLAAELGGRLGGYETATPNLATQLQSALATMPVAPELTDIRDAYVNYLSTLTGKLTTLASIAAAANAPSAPGAMRAPWTTCGNGWLLAVAGTAGLAFSIVTAIEVPGSATVMIKFAEASIGAISAAWGDLVAGGCSVPFL